MESENGRKFRFGVTGRGETLAEWEEFARRAEDLGYSTLVIGEHIDRFLAPMLALVAAAQATKRIRLAAQILINDFRHPAVLAKEAATADVLTNGRFELGIGLGSTQRDYQMLGLPMDRAGVRVERLKESVQILKAFLTQDSVSYQGRHFGIEGLTAYPKPVQRPYMPLLIGAVGPRMLKLAAEEADIISILPQATPDGSGSLEAKIALVRGAAGERYKHCEIHTWFTRVEVDGEPRPAALPYNRAVGWGSNPHPGALVPGLIGSKEQIIEQLLVERDLNDVSYVTVTGTVIDAFAPIVAKLTGG